MRDDAAALAPGSWRELLELAQGEQGEELLLERLLVQLCAACGLTGAAVYLGEEPSLERQRAVGRGEFPATLAAAAATVPLPGGGLLAAPPDAALLPQGGPLLVALAAVLDARRLRRRLKQQRFTVAYRGVELEALYDVGLAIASTLELEELADAVLLRAVSLLDARRGALYLRDDGDFRLDRTLGGAAPPELAAADPRLVRLLAGTGEGGEDLLPGAQHLLAVPIESEGAARGLLLVADKESRRGIGPFGERDRRTLGLFANQAAIALQNARLHRQALEKERLERDLDLAADIQRRLLPDRLPDLEGFEVVGWSRPARHVGGDYYDIHRLEPDRLALVIADVAGKGMAAALLVSTLHSALRLLVADSGLGEAMIARLNQHLVESSGPNKFITLLVAEADLAGGGLAFVNAGHNPALLRRAGGELEELLPGGLPLGLFAPAIYRLQRTELRPGDLLCLFSDGITECESPAGEEFGTGRLVDLLAVPAATPLAEVMRGIERAVTDFARGERQGDDQTVVLLRRLA